MTRCGVNAYRTLDALAHEYGRELSRDIVECINWRPTRTRVVGIAEGFDFPGSHIRQMRKRRTRELHFDYTVRSGKGAKRSGNGYGGTPSAGDVSTRHPGFRRASPWPGDQRPSGEPDDKFGRQVPGPLTHEIQQ
jgi:hypothetical protein